MYKWVIHILPCAYFATRLRSLFPIGSWNVLYWGSFSVFIHHRGIQICIERWPLSLLHNLWGTMKRQVMRVIAICQQVCRNVHTLSFWDRRLTVMQWVWLLAGRVVDADMSMKSSQERHIHHQPINWYCRTVREEHISLLMMIVKQIGKKNYLQYPCCHIVSKIGKLKV